MNEIKEKAIRKIISDHIEEFASSLISKHSLHVNDPDGVINSKKKNAFVRELGPEFMFYSALVRSFDSSFGKVLENIGNEIARVSYQTKKEIHSYILPAQLDKISELIESYSTDAAHRIPPSIDHYNNYTCIIPKNVSSYMRVHVTDHYFFNLSANEHYLIELKAGGDLDTKKAPAEKRALLIEYFMLKNSLPKGAKVKIFFGAAYNKDGEGNEWKQSSVRSCFTEEELLIGSKYWNFVCNDPDGYKIVKDQYDKSAVKIRDALEKVKAMYF